MTLPISFYNRPTLTVARELLGARLVRILDGVKLVGLITETEAYIGEEDLACHAKAGLHHPHGSDVWSAWTCVCLFHLRQSLDVECGH